MKKVRIVIIATLVGMLIYLVLLIACRGNEQKSLFITVDSVITYSSTVTMGDMIHRSQFGAGLFDAEGNYIRFVGDFKFISGHSYTIKYKETYDPTWFELISVEWKRLD